MKYQFQVDNRPAAPVRSNWDDAAYDAIRAGYASMIRSGVRLQEQASIERIKDE